MYQYHANRITNIDTVYYRIMSKTETVPTTGALRCVSDDCHTMASSTETCNMYHTVPYESIPHRNILPGTVYRTIPFYTTIGLAYLLSLDHAKPCTHLQSSPPYARVSSAPPFKSFRVTTKSPSRTHALARADPKDGGG